MKVTFNPKSGWSYDVNTKTFRVSEKDLPGFATTYEVENPKTGNTCAFEFCYSTGPEFDPKTVWVYKSKDNFTLEVCNDVVMTRDAAANYLAAKLRK